MYTWISGPHLLYERETANCYDPYSVSVKESSVSWICSSFLY